MPGNEASSDNTNGTRTMGWSDRDNDAMGRNGLHKSDSLVLRRIFAILHCKAHQDESLHDVQSLLNFLFFYSFSLKPSQ